ncbi:MAG: alpha/beta hydrolase [Rhodospirillaceae bacterium]|nr:alpha/beta hydrolase [Rhodospirillaceae bacterium]
MPMLERSEGDIFYEVCDLVPPWVESRETILFLHGLAIDSDIWITWLPTLADRYRIVRMDLRGFGRSFVPAAGAAWSIDTLADDVLDVLAALGAQRVHFVGESTGGTVGLHLAAHHPGHLLTLTMVSAAHRGGTIGRSRALRDDVRALGMDEWSATLMPLRFPAGCLSPAMERWFHDTQRASAPQACVDLVDMLVQVDLTEALGGIRVPTLLIAPDDSPFVSLETQVERLRAMPDCEMHVVAGARHGVAYSHGPECAGALRGFLERRSPSLG